MNLKFGAHHHPGVFVVHYKCYVIFVHGRGYSSLVIYESGWEDQKVHDVGGWVVGPVKFCILGGG